MVMRQQGLGAVALAALCSATGALAQVIDTQAAWNGTSFISSFGVPNTATYGQALVVPPNSDQLTGFDVQIQLQTGASLTLRGMVWPWNSAAQRASAAPLAESAPLTISPVTPTAFQPVALRLTAPLAVAPGQALAIGATVSRDYAQPNGTSRWGALTTNTVYPDGQFVFFNNGSNESQWTNAAWSTIAQDLAFTAHFNTVLGTPQAQSSPGGAGMNVSWQAAPTTPIATSTVTTVEDPSKRCTAAAGATQCLVAGLTLGAAYTFVVTAQNTAGGSLTSPTSAPSTFSFIQPQAVPGLGTGALALLGILLGMATVLRRSVEARTKP